MFKKTEETEWTRFSKALSGQDSDETEGAAESETSANPAAARTATPAARPSASESSASSRLASRATSPEVDQAVETIIGEHTSVDGSFKSDNSVRVLGTVKGEIESKRSILVESQATVNAKLTAETVTVAGQVNGEIHCSGRVEIKPNGRVVGEIDAGILIMQEGAFFEGNLKMGERSSQVSPTESEPAAAKR